jgi:cell division transport system permease protein
MSKRVKTNSFYAIVGVSLVLFLLGAFGLSLLYAQNLVVLFKERMNVLVELEEGSTREDIGRLENQLTQTPFVKEGSVVFVSRENAAEQMRSEFGEDFLKLNLPNPFYDMITFNLQAQYMEIDSLKKIEAQIRQFPIVGEVYYQENLIDQVSANLKKLTYVAVGIGIFIIFVALLLIYNTIRLSLYANRFLIKTMQLVGASWGFISRPFFWKAAGYGLISGLLALAALMLLLLWMWQALPELRYVDDWFSMGMLALSVVLLGVLLFSFSTYLVVNKYLRMRVDDLY